MYVFSSCPFFSPCFPCFSPCCCIHPFFPMFFSPFCTPWPHSPRPMAEAPGHGLSGAAATRGMAEADAVAVQRLHSGCAMECTEGSVCCGGKAMGKMGKLWKRYPGWWFQTLFSIMYGIIMIILPIDWYFSRWLKPPTSISILGIS